MSTVTLTPSNTATTHLRDASFSSYLNCSEEAYVRKLADESFRFGRKKAGQDGEIGVFGAEKYFSEGRDNEEYPRMMFKNSDESEFARNEGVPMKASPQPITPSVYSESSSWNSQSALLKNAVRKPPHHKRRSRSLLTSIRCINCSCNDNKSVDIGVKTPKTSLDYGVFEGKQTINSNNLVPNNKAELNPWIMKQIQSRKIDETGIDDGFTFPVLSSRPGNLTRQHEIPKRTPQLYSLNLDRRTAVLPWNPPSAGGLEEESESDASSDLFEIEDFVSNGKGHNISCYAPSEASIEWSVVTASAADFEDLMPSSSSEATTSRGYKMSSTGKAGKETEKRRSGILSGCKSQKAVMVAGDAYTTNGKAVHDGRTPYRSDSFEGATRFEAEAGKIALIRKNRPYSFDLGSLSR